MKRTMKMSHRKKYISIDYRDYKNINDIAAKWNSIY